MQQLRTLFVNRFALLVTKIYTYFHFCRYLKFILIFNFIFCRYLQLDFHFVSLSLRFRKMSD